MFDSICSACGQSVISWGTDCSLGPTHGITKRGATSLVTEKRVSLLSLSAAVALVTHVSEERIQNARRDRNNKIIAARMLFAFIARKHLKVSQRDIAVHLALSSPKAAVSMCYYTKRKLPDSPTLAWQLEAVLRLLRLT